jgi:hypothetical protein
MYFAPARGLAGIVRLSRLNGVPTALMSDNPTARELRSTVGAIGGMKVNWALLRDNQPSSLEKVL